MLVKVRKRTINLKETFIEILNLSHFNMIFTSYTKLLAYT